MIETLQASAVSRRHDPLCPVVGGYDDVPCNCDRAKGLSAVRDHVEQVRNLAYAIDNGLIFSPGASYALHRLLGDPGYGPEDRLPTIDTRPGAFRAAIVDLLGRVERKEVQGLEGWLVAHHETLNGIQGAEVTRRARDEGRKMQPHDLDDDQGP